MGATIAVFLQSLHFGDFIFGTMDFVCSNLSKFTDESQCSGSHFVCKLNFGVFRCRQTPC